MTDRQCGFGRAPLAPPPEGTSPARVRVSGLHGRTPRGGARPCTAPRPLCPVRRARLTRHLTQRALRVRGVEAMLEVVGRQSCAGRGGPDTGARGQWAVDGYRWAG